VGTSYYNSPIWIRSPTPITHIRYHGIAVKGTFQGTLHHLLSCGGLTQCPVNENEVSLSNENEILLLELLVTRPRVTTKR